MGSGKCFERQGTKIIPLVTKFNFIYVQINELNIANILVDLKKNIFSVKINIFIEYRKLIINQILNHAKHSHQQIPGNIETDLNSEDLDFFGQSGIFYLL